MDRIDSRCMRLTRVEASGQIIVPQRSAGKKKGCSGERVRPRILPTYPKRTGYPSPSDQDLKLKQFNPTSASGQNSHSWEHQQQAEHPSAKLESRLEQYYKHARQQRRQDDEQAQGSSTLPDSTSEPSAAPIEPQPKRIEVWKNTNEQENRAESSRGNSHQLNEQRQQSTTDHVSQQKLVNAHRVDRRTNRTESCV
ncbi:hypothetical protein MJO28_012567 [Puccinia striiformis f. sp. tritici]|uniref:Uncharacterized protein n=1 Tax=Puccinia striiformis f. sp. tritici TaxID=168172 RepID=A0ACC0E0N5_9BASI|nr:hypothetical protein MJO28_012567 [Puccinia striiformis f. sp. tritici]